jgi:hypothetical protein
MKLQASPTIAFSAIRRPQQVASPSIAAHDSVRFGSAAIKLATITAEEIAKFKKTPTEGLLAPIHEIGHLLQELFSGHTLEGVTVKTEKLGKYIKYGGVRVKVLSENKDKLFQKAYIGLASGPVMDNLHNNKGHLIQELTDKKITPKKFFHLGGGINDYETILELHKLVKKVASLPSDSIGLRLTKFFKRILLNIRVWLNPHKELASVVKYTQKSHELMKALPEEGLFRLAKTLEQHGTIEGHDTIERLVKEALGTHYDTLQKQFNTLVTS